MNTKLKQNKFNVLSLLFWSACISCLFILGCSGSGGGTSGTGVLTTPTFEGTVSDETGTPLSGVTVTVQETGESQTTDEAGRFSFTKPDSGSEFTLLVGEGDNSSAILVSQDELSDDALAALTTSSEPQIVQIDIVKPSDGSGSYLNDLAIVPELPVDIGDEAIPCTAENPEVCGDELFCSFTDGSCGAPGGRGVCQPYATILCILLYEPVCGCDGQTYGNDCMAQGSQVSVRAKGEC